jgi:hypothetical protein
MQPEKEQALGAHCKFTFPTAARANKEAVIH